MSHYLAVDLGTTGCRSILFDAALNLIADSYREYALETPKEKWAQQDANLWWSLTLETAKEAIAKSGLDAKAIDGISISSQGITVVPVDENMVPMFPAMTWLDVRCEEQAERLEKEWGTRAAFTHTGKRIHPCYTLFHLLWLREEEPEIYNKAWKFLMPMDFLLAKFTGNCVTDHSMASGTVMYDIKNQCWSEEVLRKYDLPLEKLPVLMWSGESAGCVLPEVAAELGLREDCVVAVGAQDQKCAALGVGLGDGIMTISLGTSGAIEKLWTEAKSEGEVTVPWSSYARKGTWVTESVINTAASSLRWLRDVMFPGCDYDTITAEAYAARERGSSVMFYPFLNGEGGGPNSYPEATGCFYGASLASTRGDFALAVLEGVAFQIRIILEAMEAYGNVHTLVLFGGGSKGARWCQIIADICGMELTVPVTSEAAGAGAAIMAGQGVGVFSRENPPSIPYGKKYVPSEYCESYNEKFAKYCRMEKKMWQE